MTGTDRPTRDRHWLALTVLCAGMLIVILDGTIVTVALPSMQDDLGLSAAGLTWVVNAYLIAFGGLLLLSGRLGDLVGRKRILVAGLALFTGASLVCGLAGGAELMIAARFVQGGGGALASAASLGMLVTLFPEPRERARAIGAFSFVGAAGSCLGLVLGGVITDAVSWHWIFLVNVPIGTAAVLLALRVLPADRGPGLGAGADAAGAVLVTAGLMVGIYAIVGVTEHGWRSMHTIGFGGASAGLLVGFVTRQTMAAAPLLPLRMLRARSVSGANLVQVLMVAALFGFQVLAALYLQRVLAYDATRTGLAMLPAGLAIGILSLGLSARLGARFGERPVLLAGLALLVTSLALLARAPVDADYLVDLLPVMLLIGGFGLAIPALTTLAMSGATATDAGLAAGLFNTTQQVGGALGLAVLSTLASARTDHLLAAGRSPAVSLVGGYHLAFGVGAGLLVAAAALTLAVLPPERSTS